MAQQRGLYRRKDSPYWWIDVVLPDGRRVCKSTRLRDLDAATELLIRLKAEAYEAARTGIPVDKTWQEAVIRYLRESQDKRTRDDDLAHLRKLDPYLAGKRLRDINMDALWPFIEDRRERDQVANATINRALEVVRRILHLARDEWGWIERFPRIRMLREPKRRVRFLTREEADRLLAVLPPHLRPVVQFALATGCRMREILDLEWGRVDLERRVAWLDPGTTKNGEGRGIPLNREALLALRAVLGTHDRWCFTYKGRHMAAVGSAWKRALKRAAIEDFRFHDLRHTWASWHVMNGTSLQELMELGGWKSFEMVLRYAHLAPEHLADAAARIERPLGVVGTDSTISLRQKDKRPSRIG
ncbi:MAG: site-specific integrase [Planctomycetota bacterium]|nr:MAG: site-specific integrase [Planctomycetota bacterium]